MMNLYPSWKSNLAIFLILILLVSGYFFLQLQKATRQFQQHSREHSEVVAGVVELNVKTAITSSQTLEGVYRDFLKNSARFLHYLETIEPFSTQELTAFAAESGLVGIKITRADGSTASGPDSWLPDESCFTPGRLLFRADIHAYIYSYQNSDGSGEKRAAEECIIVGMGAEGLDRIRSDLSLDRLLSVLNRLPGIAYVKIEKNGTQQPGSGKGTWQLQDGLTVTEHVIDKSGSRLLVALEAGHFQKRMGQMRRELILFVLFLLVIGAFTSWWLYRSQRIRVEQAREFERALARQHEEAALGRAASTITHELRNPLNAIGIGLQRLQFETENLDEEHRALLCGMREAVARSNNVINRLRQYMHDFRIERERIDLVDLLQKVIALYRKSFDSQAVKIHFSNSGQAVVWGDRDLLGQVFENLVRNGLEAQPGGGYFNISTACRESNCLVTMVNGGFLLNRRESEHLFEPYFTTKAKGTGLGLALSRKVIEAHGGSLRCEVDFDRKEMTLEVNLPVGPAPDTLGKAG